MPIRTEDIKIRAPQRLADTDDGGGFMTAHEIIDGSINNLFNDISRLDRTYGRVSLRKFFMHVDTDDTEMYSGSHIIISELAKDPNINVALFTTENEGDTRIQARNRLESFVTLGPRFQGWLWGDQPAGSRSLLVFMPLTAEPPSVGSVLCLFNNMNTSSEVRQYVRVMKIESSDQDFTLGQITGGATVVDRKINRKVLTIEIGDPLEVTFLGTEMHTNDATPTSIYTTIVSDAAKYYGVMTPRAPIAAGDININVESIYTHLVPTSQSEAPMLGLTPGDAGPIQRSGHRQTLTFDTQTWTTISMGQGFVPGSLALSIGGVNYTDARDGTLMHGSSQIGLIEYPTGKITLTSSIRGSVVASFDPGVAMVTTPTTLMIPIQGATAGYNYVAIMWPPPQPGTITVDYMAQGKWYRLRDNSAGQLVPDIKDTGTGRVEYAIGQLSITTAAIPDADSAIIIRWGNPVEIVQLAGVVEIDVEPLFHTLNGTPVAPGSLSISWPTGISSTATATDDGNGNIVGDATGWINYGNGEIEFTPTLLPVADSKYSINHQKYAPQVHTDTTTSFTLPGAPLQPGSVSLDVQVSVGGWEHTYKLRDQGNGTMQSHGFFVVLNQARASIRDSHQYKYSGTTGGFSYGIENPNYEEKWEDSDTFLEDKSEETKTLTVGGISATVDYTSGAVVIDLSGAHGSKETISAQAIAKGGTFSSEDITYRKKYQENTFYVRVGSIFG